ncbi:uncharacterized protein PF3D7_1120000-like [Ptychodera flava]|uniref:uncharacterized protein PF3D7_1120000-like n=1 Tax=Ptychodera flava TaxID=63121 RepID=UPI00396A4BBD
MGALMCFFPDCGSVEDDDATIKKLEIEKTDCEHVDKIFENAATPFNETVDLVFNFQKSVADFKKLAGRKNTDSVKDTLVDLKKRYPDLEIQVDGTLKFVLVPGKAKAGGAKAEETATKLTETFGSVGNLATEIVEVADDVSDACENIVKEAREIKGNLKSQNLQPDHLLRATRSIFHNITEFRKVPDIEIAMVDVVHDFADGVREAREMIEVKLEKPKADNDAVKEEDNGEKDKEVEKDTSDTKNDQKPKSSEKSEATEMTKLLHDE